MLSRLRRVRLSPLARTTLILTVAGGALALTPVPPATSLPLPHAGPSVGQGPAVRHP